MATRLKTTQFALPQLNTLADNTLTAMTQITMYIPEFSGTVTFRKVWFSMAVMDGATMTTGNVTSKQIAVSVGGATATNVTNANTHTTSGENWCLFYGADLTTHFSTNWTSGTSKTLDVSVLVNSAAATIAMVNVNVVCYITYEYDDSQTTQIKTVYIPLDAPIGALATSKPGSAIAVIPALDTELPEASKTYRNMFIVAQGNVVAFASATDSTLSMQIDSLTAYTSQTLEMGAASDYWARFIWNITSLGMTTNATHDFFIWASVARHNHQQCYLVVTYEFDASQSNNMFVSMMMPANGSGGPMGGPTSSDFQRIETTFYIEEPSSITTKQIAFYSFWEVGTPIAGLNMRVGTGSFVTYTDNGDVYCGSNGAMTRKDDAFTLARGKNTVSFDIYRTDAADLGNMLCGFWIINYTAGKPSGGYGAANHTVLWMSNHDFSGAANDDSISSAMAPVIPESNYFANCIGKYVGTMSNGTGQPAGFSIQTERLSGETSQSWLEVWTGVSSTDGESGLRHYYTDTKNIFKRYAQDPDASRLDIESSRRWRLTAANGCSNFYESHLIITYHTITYSITGTISGSGGGTVNVAAYRTDTGEKIGSTSRSGNGSYTITWYDNTIDVFAEALEDAAHMGRSDDDVAA